MARGAGRSQPRPKLPERSRGEGLNRNETAQSAVDRPVSRVFLGYRFTAQKVAKIRIPRQACRKMREKLKQLFGKGRGRNVDRLIREARNPLLRGWMNYLRLSETKGFAEELDGWVRCHLRAILWR